VRDARLPPRLAGSSSSSSSGRIRKCTSTRQRSDRQMLGRLRLVTSRRPSATIPVAVIWRRPLPAATAACCGCAAAAVQVMSTASCDAPPQEQIVGMAAASCCLAATYLLWPQRSGASERTTSEKKALFIGSATFGGAKAGYIFATGAHGTGYYLDSRGAPSGVLPGGQRRQRQPAAPGYTKTGSGLQYRDVRVGEGGSPEVGNTIRVHYVGRLYNNRVLGEKFDSSYDRREPLSFPIGVGAVIPGWDEAVLSMKEGGKRMLIVPPHLGYGRRGTPGGPIPPNAILHFEVELVDAGNSAGLFGSVFKKMLQ
jgi:hypothetical protein